MSHPAGNMEAFSEAVHALHTSREAIGGLAAMLPVLAELFSARHALIDSLPLDDRPAEIVTVLHRDEIAGEIALYPSFIAQSPSLQLLREGGFSPVTRLSDHFTDEKLDQAPFYREIFRPAGWRDQLGLAVKLQDRALRVTLYRSHHFADDEVRMAVLLQKHIATRFVDHVENRETRENGSDWELPLISNLSVKLMPGTARKILHAYFTPKVMEGNTLPAELQTWVRRVTTLKPGSRHPYASDYLRVARPHGCLHIRLKNYDRKEFPPLLCLREELGRHDFFRLRALGLTEREIEVLFWVAQGKADSETAIILGAARKTISKHVENILIKFSADNRTAAAIKAVQWLIDPTEDVR